MKDYLSLWAKELTEQKSLSLQRGFTVVGERDKHLGPRWEFARIQLSVQPAEKFEVVDTLTENDDLRREGYLDWAIYGVLDVIMLAESSPVHGIRIIVESAEQHPVDSSRMAFRQAGRDAGRKIIEAMRAHDRKPREAPE
jgi:hypothetical protein